jgi:protein O-GlcNAc transferase
MNSITISRFERLPNEFGAAALSILVLLSCGLRSYAIAQNTPELPRILFNNFGPGIREQVREADEDARKNASDPQKVGRLAMVLQTYEEHELAIQVYERARHLRPDQFQWAYLLATCQIALGRHREAVTTLREALIKQPDYLHAQLKLADSLLATGDLNESRKLYESIIDREPASAHAHYGLGRVRAKLGEATAAESLEKACELAPMWGAAHYALALAYRATGDITKAAEQMKLYQQFILDRPLIRDPMLNAVAELNAGAAQRLRLGVELEAAGKLAESITEHERALEINPQLAQAHINLIQLYGRTNQPAKAEEHYRAALTLNPNLAEAHYNFGVMLQEQKRPSEAAQAYRRAFEANPQMAPAHLNYGALLELQQQFDDAMAHYRIAVENDPSSRQAHFQLARMLIYKGDLQEAIKQLHQTLTPEDSETPRFAYALAAAYARNGDRENGLKYARIAREKAAALKQAELLLLIERDLKRLEQAR